MKEFRILVFSSIFGAGHVKAADAIIESIQKLRPTIEIIHLDFMAFINKKFNIFIRNLYIWTIKHIPQLWGNFYQLTEKMSDDSVLRRLLNSLGHKKFAQYINLTKPDLIICTYPTVAGILAELKQNQVFDIPLITVVTDYTVHNHWIHPGVDLYLVGCKEVYERLISEGVKPSRICITGIPVEAKFRRMIKRDEVLTKLNLFPDRPTFLIMGGAYGVFSDVKLLCRILDNTEYPVQSIIVCGDNRKLYNLLNSFKNKLRNPIVLLGFVDNIEELMTAADIIITKAGGITVSEALTKSLPMIIYKPIPGQEQENATYVKKIGAAKVLTTKEELTGTLNELIKYPEKIAEMYQSVTGIIPMNSADRAVKEILKRYYSHFKTIQMKELESCRKELI